MYIVENASFENCDLLLYCAKPENYNANDTHSHVKPLVFCSPTRKKLEDSLAYLIIGQVPQSFNFEMAPFDRMYLPH